jgi:uncharacterized protein (TIGR02453 family)
MTPPDQFTGFSRKTVSFFKELKANNDKAWFDEHRQTYDEHVLAPSRLFVEAMGRALKSIAKGINADPRVNQSLFRINRDTRFSKDKTPYKTHMGIWFWEGPGKRMDCSGFYFHLEPPQIMFAAGLYCFPDHLKPLYREAAADPKTGASLRRAVNQVSQAGYEIGVPQYKRVPRGYDPEHKNADLLKFGGLIAMQENKTPPEFFKPELVDLCLEHYKAMKPIHSWLLKLTQQAAAS